MGTEQKNITIQEAEGGYIIRKDYGDFTKIICRDVSEVKEVVASLLLEIKQS